MTSAYGYTSADAYERGRARRIAANMAKGAEIKRKAWTAARIEEMGIEAFALTDGWFIAACQWSDFYRDLRGKLDTYGQLSEKQWAAVVSGFAKSQAREAEKAAAAANDPSEYVGTVGSRIMVTLNVESVKGMETAYGYSRRVNMKDELGNRFVTFTTAAWAAELEQTLASEGVITVNATFQATVKDHKEYRGVKQTSLTRAKMTGAAIICDSDEVDADGNIVVRETSARAVQL